MKWVKCMWYSIEIEVTEKKKCIKRDFYFFLHYSENIAIRGRMSQSATNKNKASCAAYGEINQKH